MHGMSDTMAEASTKNLAFHTSTHPHPHKSAIMNCLKKWEKKNLTCSSRNGAVFLTDTTYFLSNVQGPQSTVLLTLQIFNKLSHKAYDTLSFYKAATQLSDNLFTSAKGNV